MILIVYIKLCMYSFWQSMIDSVIIKKVVAVPKDAGATYIVQRQRNPLGAQQG